MHFANTKGNSLLSITSWVISIDIILITQLHTEYRLRCKNVRVIEIVIVEDVLVLGCERLVRHGRLVHLTFLGQLGPPAAVYELVEGKGVFLFVGLRRVLVVGVLLQIVLLGIERGQARSCKMHLSPSMVASSLGVISSRPSR